MKDNKEFIKDLQIQQELWVAIGREQVYRELLDWLNKQKEIKRDKWGNEK